MAAPVGEVSVRLWRDHSLTIVLAGLGAVTLTPLWGLTPGKAWDILCGFGTGFLALAIYNVAAGPLRERNRPED